MTNNKFINETFTQNTINTKKYTNHMKYETMQKNNKIYLSITKYKTNNKIIKQQIKRLYN